MFRITNSTLMDRKYPNALAYIKIEAVIRVKQKLWAVKIWAKMIWKQPSSFDCNRIIAHYSFYNQKFLLGASIVHTKTFFYILIKNHIS